MPAPPGYLRLIDLCHRLGLSRNTVYLAIARAEESGLDMTPIRLGNTTLYTEAQAQALREHRENYDIRESSPTTHQY
jgi:transposase